jgi:hypothetical protein
MRKSRAPFSLQRVRHRIAAKVIDGQVNVVSGNTSHRESMSGHLQRQLVLPEHDFLNPLL